MDEGDFYLWAHGGCFGALATLLLLFALMYFNWRVPPILLGVASIVGLGSSIIGVTSLSSGRAPFVLYLLFFFASLLPWLAPVSH